MSALDSAIDLTLDTTIGSEPHKYSPSGRWGRM